MRKSLPQPISLVPSAPEDIVAAVRAFTWPADTDVTTMSAHDYPVFLRQALEAIARDADQPMQHTVAAVLGRGLPILSSFPRVTECLDARQELLRNSCDPHVRLWLDQAVPIDLLTGGLGHRRFVVRVAVIQHRQIGLLAAGLGLQIGQCFTLALTAALIGSPYVPMDSANKAMYRTLVELRERCTARARRTKTLLRVKQPEATTVHRTIDDVLAGHRRTPAQTLDAFLAVPSDSVEPFREAAWHPWVTRLKARRPDLKWEWRFCRVGHVLLRRPSCGGLLILVGHHCPWCRRNSRAAGSRTTPRHQSTRI